VKTIMITGLALLTLVTTSFLYSATVAELQDKEKEMYAILSEYWIDKSGEVHVGNKDPKELQFAFSESLMPRLTIKQIVNSMSAAIAKFGKYLNELTNARIELQAERTKLDAAVAKLAQLLGKSVTDVLKLADQNLAALISKIADGAKKVSAYEALTVLKRLRPQFNIQTVESPIAAAKNSGSSMDIEKTKSSSSGKTAAAAAAVAKSNFKISGMSGFVGTAIQYGHCRSRHFDVVLDADGLNFITEAR